MKCLQYISGLICISSFLIQGYALDIPKGTFADGRIQFTEYNPDDVVQVNASIALGSQIVFADDEEILDIASGFSQGWEFSDRRNILFLKVKSILSDSGNIRPNSEEWNTNLLVTTNRRLYAFDLHLIDKEEDKSNSEKSTEALGIKKIVAYRMKFKYSKDILLERRLLLSAEKERKNREWESKETERRLKNNNYGVANWNYTMQVGNDSKLIAPYMAYDDGRFTYLKFSELNEFPVAFLVEGKKEESIINSHVEGDFLVLHRVAERFILRSGQKVIGIYNESFDQRAARSNASGATVPDVKRVLKPSF